MRCRMIKMMKWSHKLEEILEERKILLENSLGAKQGNKKTIF